MKTTLFFICAVLLTAFASTKESASKIINFDIKESLTSTKKIAIIATDSLDTPLEDINGIFKFTINGFEQSLSFNNGIAIPSAPIDGSTFVYFKHKNQTSSVGKLYFLYKNDDGITPVKINGLLLLLIPIIVLFISFALKRFIVAFIIMAIVYSYFSISKGLSIFQLIESAFEILKKIF